MAKNVDIKHLPECEECAELLEMQVWEEIVELLSHNLSGGAGLMGLNYYF